MPSIQWLFQFGMTLVIAMLACALNPCMAQERPDLFVLMHNSGKIERYELTTGAHRGTLISGLPPSNSILNAPDGCWLISTGNPGEAGGLLRFDPRGSGSLQSFIDIPEGYGGRLFRPTGMAWWGKRLLVASQIDGKVKCYEYPSGQWLADLVTATPGGITQIAVHDNQLFLTDYNQHAIRHLPLGSLPESALASQTLISDPQESPWGVAVASDGALFWSTASGKIFRSSKNASGALESKLWVHANAGLATPFGLAIAPEGDLFCASLGAAVSAWRMDSPSDMPTRLLSGPEVQGPASIVFATTDPTPEFHAPTLDALAVTDDKLAFFENKIRPLLIARCQECHDQNVQEAQLRLDLRAGWQTGGRSGKAVVPGKPEASLLIQAVLHADKDLKMPPDEKLSASEIELLSEWVRTGAIDPRDGQLDPTVVTTDSWEEEFQKRLNWWSLQPMSHAQPPELTDDRWSTGPVDRFIWQQLRASSLAPAPPASNEVLARRLSHVLTGLPLPVSVRAEYLKRCQEGPDGATAWLVDNLIDSPHFGERMARHWMDAVRYTDTYGYEWDNPAKGSHEYRDYLIRAFNEDVPYDRFVREQLAGDLLPDPRINEALGINESIIGPMFYHLGEHRHGSSLAFNGIHQEMMNNKIDAFSKVFLATTVACARCHDHKREAVSQQDYYALGAVFMTPRWVSRPADAPGKNEKAIERLLQLRTEIAQELSLAWKDYSLPLEQLRTKIAELRKADKAVPPTITQVLYPLWKLYSTDDAAARSKLWQELTTEFAAARQARLKSNELATLLGEFPASQLPTGWVIEGEGFESGWTKAGTPLVALDGEQAIASMLSQGLHSHALSSKLPGVLRMPPQHTVPGKFTSLLIAGEQYSGSLVLDENSFQNETVTFFKDTQPVWRTYADAALKNGVTRVTIDFATSALNANFPPRTGLAAGLPASDLGFDKRSSLSVCGIATHDSPAAPQDTLDGFIELYTDTPVADRASVQSDAQDLNAGAISYEERRVVDWFEAAVERWCAGQANASDVDRLNFLLGHHLLPSSHSLTPKLSQLVAEYRALEAAIEFPRTVNSMDERQVSKAGVYFNVRGNVDAMGQLVMPDGLQMFASRNHITEQTGSGRLQLAQSLLDTEHPLTSRVYVNRVWQWVFGQALVGTPDDFGRLGERPSHPELLDWLARQFIASGWSTKRLVRELVLSQTFRQSGQVSTGALQVDPANRLYHHYPTRRFEAEEVRDALLAVSGQLDRKLYGRPINPPRTVEDESKRLFSGPIDGHGRRSIYLTMSIMAPPKFLTNFDLPDLKLPSGKRNLTNVPTQALQMLNDPLVVQQAEAWAKSLVDQPCSQPAERLDAMYLSAYGRMPSDGERVTWLKYVAAVASQADTLHDLRAWTQVAHAIFNTKEFIYYR